MTSCAAPSSTQVPSSLSSRSTRRVAVGPVVSGSNISPVGVESGQVRDAGVEGGVASESEEVEDVDEEQPVGIESSDAKASRRIAGPSLLERSQHEVLHTPYREWGRHCQAYLGRQRAHGR